MRLGIAWGLINKIRTQSALCEGHIFLVGYQPYDSFFLTVPGGELVSDFRDAEVSGSYPLAGTVLSFSDYNGIHNTVLVISHGN